MFCLELVSKVSAMASAPVPARHRSKWSLDFATRGSASAPASNTSPPGYSSSMNAVLNMEGGRGPAANSADLRVKRSWDIALGPIKQVPMNLFMMYMSGTFVF